MLFENTKTLEFNQYQKYYRVSFIIYGYLKCVIEKIHGYKSNPENSSTTKKKKTNIFHQVFQRLQYRHLEVSKIGMMYTEIKIA